ncbi:glycine zipper domain-containing protein [Alterisphingorhabdus coralli]|uniref:Glycine zipper domain-containing protein n=1 Tax=Alterisphingorhabdus coralli TaxID=3071408 RepID=A0AA97F642_9SPHN|nr:glycine zipper domain-containing protein [Parasphingorhabdus sp. SCSIO 66989]WOE74151.1 glycine zipper domain-containing protein [Parasphingorhabdus sp. SCSIO 66989]
MRKVMLAVPVAMALTVSACAGNYAAEGAGVGAVGGAIISGVTGGDVIEGAAIGAAAGAAVGYFVDKNDECDGYNRNGRLDDDCYGLDGYPDRRPD